MAEAPFAAQPGVAPTVASRFRPGHGDGQPDDRCTVLHVDMDAFFASVEILDDPSLAGRAVAVGGDSSRGAIASCSYEARARGVRSAMATALARRCCPDLVVVPPRHHRYVEVSHQLHQVLRDVTAMVEPVGLDEAFLDVSGARRRGAPPAIGWHIVEQVQLVLGLTCAVGVARTKSLAKLASRRAKAVAPADRGPGDGLVVVTPDDERAFLDPLPVTELWGVGPATAQRLARYGVHRVVDLAAMPPLTLRRLVGRSAGEHLAALARGSDTTPVTPARAIKSIGRETTVAQDLFELADLANLAVTLARPVGDALRVRGTAARHVTIKVRFADRRTITRTATLTPPATGPRQVLEASLGLLATVDVTAGVRLLGVAASSLVPREAVVEQLQLIPDAAQTSPVPRGAGPRPPGGAIQSPSSRGDGHRDGSRGDGHRDGSRGDGHRDGSRGDGHRASTVPDGDAPKRPPPARWRQVDDVLDTLHRRFGAEAVVRAVDAGTMSGMSVDR